MVTYKWQCIGCGSEDWHRTNRECTVIAFRPVPVDDCSQERAPRDTEPPPEAKQASSADPCGPGAHSCEQSHLWWLHDAACQVTEGGLCSCIGGPISVAPPESIIPFEVATHVHVETLADCTGGYEASDTERPSPPALPSKACYFCGETADDEVYWGMPACNSCKRRASSRRRDR